jgi:hypothetical protein
MSQKSKQLGLTTPPGGTWVTDRAAHERWAQLAIANPRASSVLHVLVAQMGRHNAIVASQTTLAKAAHCSLPTLKRALSILREQGWIEVRQIGPTGQPAPTSSMTGWHGPASVMASATAYFRRLC